MSKRTVQKSQVTAQKSHFFTLKFLSVKYVKELGSLASSLTSLTRIHLGVFVKFFFVFAIPKGPLETFSNKF